MTYERFKADNAALLLIDHQIGTMGWVKSIPFEEMKRNALILAQAATILKLPVVLTSSMEEHAQGPLLSELKSILPAEFSGRIKRAGIVNAMDVCTVYPALSLVRDGFEVQVVADAGGSPSKMADDIALRRMERGGVTLTSTNQLIAELAGNWTTPEGGQLVRVLMGAPQA
jgi:nicotinamidase-related amidase